jgi:hypothetical protein
LQANPFILKLQANLVEAKLLLPAFTS